MDSTLVLKLAVLLPVFLLTFFSGYIPIRSKRFKSNEKLIGLTSSFSGGVFLAIALIHIIPETTHLYHAFRLINEPLSS